MGNSFVVKAVLDRLLQHSHVLNIREGSYRLWDVMRANFFRRMRPKSEMTQTELPSFE